MKAMQQTASGGKMRGPRGGVYHMVGGKKVYGESPAEHVTEPKSNVAGQAVRIGSTEHKEATKRVETIKQRAKDASMLVGPLISSKDPAHRELGRQLKNHMDQIASDAADSLMYLA